MKKILFIDTWRKGYRNFTRLNEEFVNKGYSTILVHTGSFIENADIKEEFINGLHIRDISFYNTIFIKKVIEIEKPDVILMLNLSFIFDRALVNIAKFKNIKIVYLAHGKLIEKDEVGVYEKNLNKNIWLKITRIFKKRNFIILLNYISSHKGFQKVYLPIKLVVRLFINPSRYLVFPRYDSELDADLILLYTNQDKELMIEKFNFNVDKILVVGNTEIPEFINSPLVPKNEFLSKLGIKEETEYILYLDDGLVVGNIWTADDFYSHLNEILSVIGRRKLVIKLHPRENLKSHLIFFKDNGIIPIIDTDFKNLILHSEFIVSHYSSTIIYGLIFNKNIYVPRWGKSKKLIKNYPEGVVAYCRSLSDFKEKIILNNIEDSKIKKEYLNRNGINLEVNSIKLVVNKISKLFNE